MLEQISGGKIVFAVFDGSKTPASLIENPQLGMMMSWAKTQVLFLLPPFLTHSFNQCALLVTIGDEAPRSSEGEFLLSVKLITVPLLYHDFFLPV